MKVPGRCGKFKKRSAWAVTVIVAVIFVMGLAPAFGSGGGEGGHEAESKPWMKTDTAKVLNFAVLAIGLFLVLRKPVSQALSDRIKGIKEELEELEGRKAEVEKQLHQYNTKLATLDKEAEQVIAEYIRQGEEAKARILKEAESAADKLEEQAKKNIENEFKQAKEELQAEIVEKALVRAEQAVKEKISAQDQERLVDEYLAKVVA
ncbi:MAG: ATP synthase F0 subunit B [Desulfobacteraceae bacterium]|jgi:F-type H+-transporting ATPase subunit b